MRLFIQSIANPTLKFEVLSFDKNTKQGLLCGEYGAEFSRDLSKEALAKYGYRVVKEDSDAEQPKLRTRHSAGVQNPEATRRPAARKTAQASAAADGEEGTG